MRFNRIKFKQKTIDMVFDWFVLITSIITLLFCIFSLIPLILLLPDYWIRPFFEYLVLVYFSLRGINLWRKEVS